MARKASRGYSLGWKHVLGLYAEQGGAFMLLMGALTAVMTAVQRKPRRAA